MELQMSMVGGVMLINSNNRQASQALYSGMNATGALGYVGRNAPPVDKDRDRAERHLTKLNAAVKGERPWQKSPGPEEDPDDLKHAQAVTSALSKSGSVGLLDPDAEDFAETLKTLKSGKGHSTYVLLHPSSKPEEHAERVQSDFRKAHLSDIDPLSPDYKPSGNPDEPERLSTPPVGPKTPCLGCASYHEAHHPNLGVDTSLTGAYFHGSSPATSTQEVEKALEIVERQPATGAVTQGGYQSNSNYPDSDTDTEGKPSYPRPLGYRVPFGSTAPKKMKWRTGPTASDVSEFNRSEKRPKAKQRLDPDQKPRRKRSPPTDATGSTTTVRKPRATAGTVRNPPPPRKKKKTEDPASQ